MQFEVVERLTQGKLRPGCVRLLYVGIQDAHIGSAGTSLFGVRCRSGPASKFAQRLRHGQSRGTHGRQKPADQADDQRHDYSLHEQLPGYRKVEYDLTEAIAV